MQEGPTNDNSNPQQGCNMPPVSSNHTTSKNVSNGTTHANNNNNNKLTTTTVPPQQSNLTSHHHHHQNGGSGMVAHVGASHAPRHFKTPPTKKDTRKLFVGGLPANITEGEFREFFEQFGVLIDSVVMFDRDTGRSRGFGFVTFEDETVAQKILMTGNEDKEIIHGETLIGKVEMQGKICEVKSAQPKDNSRGRPPFMHRGNGAPNVGGKTPMMGVPQVIVPVMYPQHAHGYDDTNASSVMAYPSVYHPSMMQMYYPQGHYGHHMYGNYMVPHSSEYPQEIPHMSSVPSSVVAPLMPPTIATVAAMPVVPPHPIPPGVVVPVNAHMAAVPLVSPPPEPIIDGTMAAYGFVPPMPAPVVMTPVHGSVMQHAPPGNVMRDGDIEGNH